MKRHIIFLLTIALAILPACKQAEKQANLLFIITDQQRFDALGMVGNFPFLQTPNLDKLANEGVWFDHTYTQCAVCAPARAVILTGCTVENNGVYTNYFDNNKHTPMQTFDEVLTEKGYYTEFHGKFHDPAPMADCYAQRTGYEDYFAYLDENCPPEAAQQGERIDPTFKRAYRMDPIDPLYGKAPDAELVDESGHPLIQPDQHGELLIPAEHSITAYQAKRAIEAIQRAKESGKPFSITCSFHFPHSPILPTTPYHGMYSPENIALPASLGDKMLNSPYFRTNGRDYKPEYADPDKIKYLMSNYFGLITEIDDWVGKLLNTLEENGLAENTLVIFTSDHGEMLGSHGMREKNVFYEESARVPLMMRFPKRIKSGVQVSTPISNVNLYATIFDYLGVEGNASDGHSLRPLIEGKDSDHFEYVVTEWNYNLKDNEPNYMILKDDWKLFIPYTSTSSVPDALFKLKDDPFEMHNLLGNNPDRSSHQDQADILREDLLKWLEEHGSSHHNGVKERNF